MTQQILQQVAQLHAQGKFEDALRLAAENINARQHHPDLLHLAAQCSVKLKLHGQAVQCWERAIALRPAFTQAHFGLADLYRETGKFAEAERHYRRVLALDARYPNLYSHLGFVLKAQKRLDDAEEYLRRGMVLQPDPFIACNLGRLYVELNRFDEAENYFRHALAQQPTFAAAYFNLGLLQLKRNRLAEAEGKFRQAIQLDPMMVSAHVALGNLYAGQKRFEEAETCYQKAIDLNPNAPEFIGNLGALYAMRGLYPQAEMMYRCMLAAGPNYAGGHFNFANMLTDLERYAEAETHYRTAIQLNPAEAVTWLNYGNMLRLSGRTDESVKAYRRAIDINPGNDDAHNGLGMLHYEANRFDEAEACYRQALRLAPRSFRVHVNLGILYKMRNDFAAATDWYMRARALESEQPLISYSLALLKLAQGDFEEGWRLYEARYDERLGKPITRKPNLPYPQWQGETLTGKSIVIVHEQGFGDVIQFARYAADLKRLGASVSLLVKKPLQNLLSTLDGVTHVFCFADIVQMQPHDYWTFPLSIPFHLQTRLETIPATVGPFSVPPDYRTKWQGSVTGEGLKIGLVWKGSASHTNDSERSLSSLADFAPLWDIPGITFVSLQKGQGQDDAAQPPAGQPLLDLGSRMEDFADAAAIIEQLDLVICVDTAIAHLAGAMGKPVWLLTPFMPDWRWMLKREDSPWYPTMRLFRQQSRSDWKPVIERIKSDLSLYIERSGK